MANFNLTKEEWISRYRHRLIEMWKVSSEAIDEWVSFQDGKPEWWYGKVDPERYADDDFNFGD